MEQAGKNIVKLLKVLNILRMYTDENKSISVKEIIDLLDQDGISCERKSVYQYIEILQDMNYDILTIKSKQNQYCLLSREFELPELKLLADAVLASKFIDEKKAKALVGKLAGLTSIQEGEKLTRQQIITSRPKTSNIQVYIIINSIHNAIAEKKMISFKYSEYNIHKETIQKKNGKIYKTSPLNLIWNDEKYYLLAYNEKYNSITHYRVDKMQEVKELSSKAIPLPPHLNINAHIQQVFNMYAGKEETVTIKIHHTMIGQVIDKFGTKIKMLPYDAEHSTIQEKIFVSPTFFAWIFQFGKKMQILAPANVIVEMTTSLSENMKQYQP
jgi:predicted DNA-binding transcriptional regulator YafY